MTNNNIKEAPILSLSWISNRALQKVAVAAMQYIVQWMGQYGVAMQVALLIREQQVFYELYI